MSPLQGCHHLTGLIVSADHVLVIRRGGNVCEQGRRSYQVYTDVRVLDVLIISVSGFGSKQRMHLEVRTAVDCHGL